ncbi:hypothetical protein ADK38_18145, partial [Streptomyces varsoviensis]
MNTASPAGLRRPDGPAKLTGTARYAADTPAHGAAYAILVGATVPTGRLTALHTEAARGAPGVSAVLTAEDLPDMPLGPLVQPLPMRRAPDG